MNWTFNVQHQKYKCGTALYRTFIIIIIIAIITCIIIIAAVVHDVGVTLRGRTTGEAV